MATIEQTILSNGPGRRLPSHSGRKEGDDPGLETHPGTLGAGDPRGLREYGLLDVAVDLIREGRDEE